MSRIPVASLANGTLLASVPLVSSQNPTGAPMLTPAVGAQVHIYLHDTAQTAGNQASIWSAETNGVVLTQPLSSGTDGTVPGFIDTADLPADLAVNGATYVLAGGSSGVGGGGSGVVVSVVAEDATVSVDGTTPNPTLRVPALSGLLTADADQGKQTSSATYRGGELGVVYERLNALDGFLTPGSAADQGAQLQAFVTAVGSAVGGGGAGLIPTGVYKSSTYPSFPGSTTCDIEGETHPGYPGAHGTVIQFTTDTGGVPETQGAINLISNGAPHRLAFLTLLGPGGASAPGVRPAALAGVRMQASTRIEGLHIENFGAPVLLGGGNTDSDHIEIKQLITRNCAFGIYQGASRTYGDFDFSNLRLTANLAAMGCDSASNGFGGLQFGGDCGFYAPYGFFRRDTGVYGGVFISGMPHFGVNIEQPAHGAIYDELWAAGNGIAGIVSLCDFSAGSIQNPQGGITGWSGVFACSVSGSTITLTTSSGFVFRKNMLASGTGWAGQTVTAIASTASATDNWAPPGTSVTYTITMSGPPTGSPTSITLTMPARATIACGAISDVEFGNSISSETAIVTPFLVAPQGAHDNRLSDGAVVKAYIDAGQQFVDPITGSGFSSSFVYGNQWGSVAPGSSLYTSMQAVNGTVISANDLVEVFIDGNSRRLQRAQGTGAKVIGAAQQAVSSGHPTVDVLCATSGKPGGGTLLNNSSGVTINIGARVKVDTSHPGCVAACASASDVSVGVALATFATGTAGAVALDIGTIGVPSGPAGGSGGSGAYGGASLTPALDGNGNVVVTIASGWGIDPATGLAYFNATGATDGQEAILGINSDGTLSLTQIQGQVP